jgi:hypothetical protein
MVVHTCNPSNGEAEVGGSQVQGQPELYRELVSQKQKRKEEEEEEEEEEGEKRPLWVAYPLWGMLGSSTRDLQ